MSKDASLIGSLVPGTALPQPPAELITRDRILRFAGASGDYNPMHVDEVTNLDASMGGVFAHGMLGTGFLGRMATDCLGDVPLTSLSVRCTAIVRPGDSLFVDGLVLSRRMTEAAAEVVFRLRAVNQNGDVTHDGMATAVVPMTFLEPKTGASLDQSRPFVTWRAIG